MTLKFSRQAESDLRDITAYTLERWGEVQADRYLLQLEVCCSQLADRPTLGRPCDDVRPGLRRMSSGRHVVFYREHGDGIWVTRILHVRMLPERHDMDQSVDR